ncbi:MAG TPA: hypothetical protein ENJ35_01565 [Gammaproteobacteria bacterium]|nr:hypothetical protein [Gammaproteobacteria bacterium]
MKSQVVKYSVLAMAISLSSGMALATTPGSDTSADIQGNAGSMVQANDRDQVQAGEKPENGRQKEAMNQNRERHQMRQHAGKDGRPELFTSEERAEFRDSMRSAETMEERHAIRDTMRATRIERAEAAGISRPDRADMDMRGQRHERPETAERGSRDRSGH